MLLDILSRVPLAPADVAGLVLIEPDCHIALGVAVLREEALRQKPSTEAAIVARLAEGAQVRHLCATQVEGGRTWASVTAQAEGETVRGWVSEEFLRQP